MAKQNFGSQISQRPWLVLGAAVLTGYLLNRLGGSQPRPSVEELRGYHYHPGHQPERATYRAVAASASRYDSRPSAQISQRVMGQAGEEMYLIRQAALAAITGAVKATMQDTFKNSFSGLAQDVLPAPTPKPAASYSPAPSAATAGWTPSDMENTTLNRKATQMENTTPKKTTDIEGSSSLTSGTPVPGAPGGAHSSAQHSHGARAFATPEHEAARSVGDDSIDHFEKKGSFATGMAEKELVEGSNVREGSYATGLGDPESGTVAQPDPNTTDVVDHTQVEGSFATGMTEKELVEGSNVREGNFANKDDSISDEEWLKRKLSQQ